MKILYIDTETTGINPEKNAIIQLSGMIEVDGEIKSTFNYKVRPHEGAEINDMALQVNHTTKEQLMAYDPMQIVYTQFVAELGKFCNKFDRSDKYYIAGYNVKFDIDFLAAFFRRNNDPYLGSWINWRAIDPITIMHWMDFMGLMKMPDYKLATVCDFYHIPLDAHDAMNDIKATREVIKRVSTYFEGVKI